MFAFDVYLSAKCHSIPLLILILHMESFKFAYFTRIYEKCVDISGASVLVIQLHAPVHTKFAASPAQHIPLHGVVPLA